jgi:hypothetical protein
MKRLLLVVLLSIATPATAVTIDQYISKYGNTPVVFGDPPKNTEWDWSWHNKEEQWTVVAATRPNQSDVVGEVVALASYEGDIRILNPKDYLFDLPSGPSKIIARGTRRTRLRRRDNRFYWVQEKYASGEVVLKKFFAHPNGKPYLYWYEVDRPRR